MESWMAKASWARCPRGVGRGHPEVAGRRGTPRPPHLSPQQLEVADVAVSVDLAVHHHLDGVLLHLRAEPSCDRRGRVHGGARVDLDEPGLEVAAEDEVGAVQLEAVLPRVYVVLGHLHGVGDGPLHGRVDDAAPHGPAAPLLQVNFINEDSQTRIFRFKKLLLA